MERSARRIAADLLVRIEKDGAYSTLSLREALREAALPDGRDAALVTRLVYGVTERRLTLDYNLSLYLKQPLRKLPPPVLAALRLGAYQILFSDKIPAAAAVNESVALTRQGGFSYAAGLVNAVLRKIAAAGLSLPPETDRVRWLSVRYSVPEWLVSHFSAAYGETRASSILASFFEPRPVFIRHNALKCSAEALCASLAEDGVPAQETAVPGAYRLNAVGDLTKLRAFADGWFFVQDLSSQRCAASLGAKPGETVVDCCAAPGGKAFSVAIAMENRGRVIACDLYPQKTKLIEDGAKRLGIDVVETVCCDARTLPDRVPPADRVLCDVPCSGLGVIGRKPEIRYKDPALLAELPALQLSIVSRCAALVKPGGTLVYSTCTLNPAENEDVCAVFLRDDPAFVPAGDAVNYFPDETDGDGFFVAVFQRV